MQEPQQKEITNSYRQKEIDVLCQRLMSNYQRSARLIVLTSLTYQKAALNADKFQWRRTERASNDDAFSVLSGGKRMKLNCLSHS